jgi:hypothetical protein
LKRKQSIRQGNNVSAGNLWKGVGTEIELNIRPAISAAEAHAVSDIETRVELFSAFQELSEVIPEMRSGQLMAAVGELCADIHGRGLWDATDVELIQAVWQFRRNYEAAVALTRDPAQPR